MATCIILAVPQSCPGQVESSISEPFEWSNVAAAETGVLAAIHVKTGDWVRRGDLIAQLDCSDLEPAIRLAELKAEARAAIRSAEAVLRLRKSQRDNLLSLQGQGFAHTREVDDAIAQFDQAEADLAHVQELQQQNQQELLRLLALKERRWIRSPIDGVVVELHHRIGEFVSANEPQVATVVNLDQLRVRFYLLRSQLESLEPGQALRLQYENPDQSRAAVPAVIEFVSPVTDPRTGLSRVDALIDNRSLPVKLRSGIPCFWPDSSPAGQIHRSADDRGSADRQVSREHTAVPQMRR